MSRQSKTDRKMCGTCEYWNGDREPVFNEKGIPKIQINTDEGFCEKQGSRFLDELRKYDLRCKCYSKWTEIL